MNMVLAVILLTIGLLLLWKAADWLVVGAVNLAERLGISPLVIGLTIIAMGTSAPEAATSIAAVLRDNGEIVLGNVYGSNIVNLLVAGGICALIRPVSVRLRVLKLEMPVMILTALALWPMLMNLYLSRIEGVILLGVFAVLIILTVFSAKKQAVEKSIVEITLQQEVQKIKPKSIPASTVLIITGLLGLALGAEISLRGAVYIGQWVGLSDTVIGLTIIAVGTSLPEIATSIVAAKKGHDDIAIGNLVGSNIFNTLLVAGIAGTVRPFVFAPRLAGADYWIMIGASIIFVIMSVTGKKISRFEGAILTAGYAGYIVYLLAFTAGV